MPPKKDAKFNAKNITKLAEVSGALSRTDLEINEEDNIALSDIISVNVVKNLKMYLNDKTNFDEFVKKLSMETSTAVCIYIERKMRNYTETLDKMVADNNKLRSKIDELENRAEEMDSYARRLNLKFLGLERSENENAEEVIKKICLNHLKINVNSDHISVAHRLPTKTPEKPPILIVRFTSYKMRDLIFKNKKLFKGTNIMIVEDLTKRNMDFLYRCKDLLGKSNVWTFNCIVKAKEPTTGKIFTIKNENDYLKLQELIPDP